MRDGNRLLYGDNLGFLSDPDVLATESVDLIYLDPPFNSNATYNVLLKEVSGETSPAQVRAFDDTWTWDASAAEALAFLMHDKHTPPPIVTLMRTFHQFMGHTPMLAYLVQMSVRLVHMRRILKPTGSLYLHCDPTASHYLKLVLDGVFGSRNFVNEIVWKRTHAHGSARRFGPVHDTMLFYSKGDAHLWTYPKIGHDPEYVRKHFTHVDEATGRLYQPITLTGSGVRKGESGKPWRKVNPTKVNRHWAIPGDVLVRHGLTGKTVQERLDALDEAGLIHWAKDRGGVPRLKWFEDELAGVAVPDVWTDIPPIAAKAAERLHYPTQKPIALLKRVICASSLPGAVILDPFCGCGTTIDAVESLNRENPDQPARRWVGIDVTHLAVNLIKWRLRHRFDPQPNYVVVGEPKDTGGARQLFKDDPFQFQYWACGLVGARPVGAVESTKSAKKGTDRGVDGVRFFVDDNKGPKSILVQVKGGRVGAKDVRDFRGTIERENAALGVFISLEPPTKPMQTEAAGADPYVVPGERRAIPRIQVVTVEDLLRSASEGREGIILPPHAEFDRTLKKAKAFDEATLFTSPSGRFAGDA